MKILFVQKVKALVGSEKYFLELIPELEKRGHQISFVCIYAAEDLERTQLFIDAYKELNLPLHLLEIKSEKQILKAVRFIKNVVKKSEFDLIHSHLIHADLWCALLKKIYRLKIPVVSTKHGYDEAYIAKHGFDHSHLEANRYYRICKYSEKYISKSFAVSDGLRKLFVGAKICKAPNIRTIHHGFDLPEISKEPNATYRFAEQQLVMLGRIIPFKGHRYLVQALAHIKKEFSNFQLVVVGHGDEDLITELAAIAETDGTSENLRLVGYQPNIYDYLNNSDIMVVPSISEGFGLVFLEALNAKIPIIGFDVAATNEIIVDGETGVLVPLRDVHALATAIIKLLKDDALKSSYSEAGFNRLKQYFSLDRMVTETVQFYEETLAEHS